MLECVFGRRRGNLRLSVHSPCSIFNGLRFIASAPGRRSTIVVVLVLILYGIPSSVSAGSDLDTAEKLATLLRSARTVISANQDLINDATIVDKGLTGDVVARRATKLFEDTSGISLENLDGDSRVRRFLDAQVSAIREVVDEHQTTINKPNIGFKGFVPATFARLVNERFTLKVGNEARIKVTAPRELVRNRKALPDPFESEAIEEHFRSADWPRGQILMKQLEENGTTVVRILVPEYYAPACLTCHGGTKSELDITGYPKEGRKLGELGGVISIRFFQPANRTR